MAIWTEYTTKNVPEDEDTLMIYDASGNENKQLPVSGMSEKIVNDVLKKELDIETENKTIPGAVNELHRDIEGLVDETLSISGKAADAAKSGEIKRTVEAILDGTQKAGDAKKVNGHTVSSDVPDNAVFTDTVYDDSKVREDIGQLKEDKVNKPSAADDGKIPRAKEGEVEWVEVGQPTDDQTNSAVTKWLAKHPEATTTVQDGSIEEIKINKNFLPWIKKDYVTPEMFGAVGDGIIDDSNAMLSAVATGLPIRGGKGKKYAIKSELVFRDNCDISSIHIIANAKIECVIKYSKRNTRIHNIQIDCNDLADYGILGASDTPMDTLYFASIKNCSVYNALIDGYNTGMVRTFINDCIAKKCANAGFYIGVSDTKHDNLVPTDCKYGVYVNSGNTSINRFHPWSWEKEQIGLFVETSYSVSIGYYFNDTNQCAISFSAGTDITIGTLRNFNNTSAPSAISEGCRMLTKNEDGQTYIPYITIGTICGSFSGFDDYFLYPNNYNINYMSVQRINLINVNTRFDKKMFRLSYVPVSLYNKVLEKFSIISDILTITSCLLQKCETDLNGYKIRIEVEFEHSNSKLEPLNDILNIQYIGTDTNTAYYRILNASASYTALSFHSTRKTNDDNKLKGMGLRCNNSFTLNGVLILYLDLYVELYQ